MKILKKVKRFDFGELRGATRTPQGFLMCPGFATRTGVFPYLNGDGSVRMELRHPEDVFDPLSMATLKSAPVTIEHPPVMVTPLNVGEYRKGHVTERVEVNRDMLDTDLIVEDQDAIDAVEKDGMRELSSGYLCDVIEEDGVFEGTPYTHRQKNIKYNHLAIVKRGRAGPEVRMRLDSADAVMQEAANEPETSVDSDFVPLAAAPTAPQEMKKVIILGREVDLPSDVADTIQDYTDRFDEMRARLAQMEDHMAFRKDKKDVDISQPGVSPQVKVEQQTPDGRAAGAKVPARPGTITGGKADKEEEKDDADEKDKKDAEAVEDGEDEKDKKDGEEEKDDADEKEDDEPAAGKGGGGSESDVDRLKKDAEDMQKKADAAKGKFDQAAAASMNKPEKKEDKEKMDSAMVQKQVRARVKLERQAEKLVPYEIAQKFDSMSDREIMAATIKYRHSKADLDGKSVSYLQSRFDSIVEALEEEGTTERQRAGKELLGLGGGRMDSSDRTDALNPGEARLKMVSQAREMYKQPLSASKK